MQVGEPLWQDVTAYSRMPEGHGQLAPGWHCRLTRVMALGRRLDRSAALPSPSTDAQDVVDGHHPGT